MKPDARGIHLKVDLNVVVTLLLLIFLAVSGTITASATPPNQNPAQTDSPDPNSGAPDTENLEGEAQVEGPLPDSLTPNGEEDPLIGPGASLEGELELSAVSGAGNKSFYITMSNFNGANALTACSAGYHLASLWELHDTTGLTYAASHPAAKTRSDNGFGPTAGWWGWARTGNDAYVENVAGRANCSNWTSSTGGHYGTIVRLTDNWILSAEIISPWDAQTWSCSSFAPAWCIGD